MNNNKDFKFRCSITDGENNKIVFMINKHNDLYNMAYINAKEINNEEIKNSIVNIDENEFYSFFDSIDSIVSGWKANYKGTEDNNAWTLILNGEGSEKRFSGLGAYPDNWEDFVSLLVLYKDKSVSKKIKSSTSSKKHEPARTINTIKEISIEYSIGGLGRFEKTILSGIHEGDEFWFGNTFAPKVKIFKITEESVILGFSKSLNLGSPKKELCEKIPHKDDIYEVELSLDEQLDFEPFIHPATLYSFTVTGIFETEQLYYE